MKTRHGLIALLITAPLAVVLRVIQYIFIIDKKGYYTDSLLSDILVYSLYAVLTACAVYGIVLMLLKKKPLCTFEQTAKSGLLGVLLLIIGGITAYTSGTAFGRSIFVNEINYLSLLGIFAAFGYVLIGSDIIGKRQSRITAFFALFPPVYILARAINEFFDTFKHITMSASKIDMLVLCVLAMFVMSLCAQRGEGDISINRMIALSVITCTLCAMSAVSLTVAMIMGKVSFNVNDMLSIVIRYCFAIISFITLVRVSVIESTEPETETVPDPIIEQLDKYLDEIPDEETEDNEQE